MFLLLLIVSTVFFLKSLLLRKIPFDISLYLSKDLIVILTAGGSYLFLSLSFSFGPLVYHLSESPYFFTLNID